MQTQRIFILCLLCFCFAHTALAQDVVEPPQNLVPITIIDEAASVISTVPQVAVEDISLPYPLLNNIEYYIDEEARMTIESVSNNALVSTFAPYNALSLPNTQGLVWLRMSFDAFSVLSDDIFLDLGDNLQGWVNVWYSTEDSSQYTSLAKDENNLYSLDALVEGGEIYIAIEGLPSLWFSPQLRSPEPVLEDLLRVGLFALIAVLSLLCFLRSIFEKSDWRFWGALFGAFALAVAYLGIPATPKGQLIPSDMFSIFALAGTLFSLSMLGRYSMALPYNAKRVDFFFLLMGVLGVFTALIPFVAQFSWLVRYVELWQLCAAVLLLPTMYLMTQSIRASARYFLILLALIVSGAIALLGIGGSVETPFWALIPHMGLAFALFIVWASPKIKRNGANRGSSSRKTTVNITESLSDDDDEDALDTNVNTVFREGSTVVGEPLPVNNGKVDEKQSSRPILMPLVIKDTPPQTLIEPIAIHNIVDEKINNLQESPSEAKIDSAEIWYENTDLTNSLAFTKMEQALRVPLEAFMHEMYFIEQQLDGVHGDGKANLQKHVHNLMSIGKDLSSVSTSLPRLVLNNATNQRQKKSFNLQEVLKQVYEKVRYEATSSHIALSWLCSPHLGTWYVGDKDALASLLYQLLSDSIRATQSGIVYLHVQRDETSNNYGRLKFVIGDSGDGQPPQSRASSLLSKVWELTALHNGEMKMETSANGIEYSFILAFIALENDGTTEKRIPEMNKNATPQRDPESIIVVAEENTQRHLLSFKLEKLPCHIFEAMSLDDCFMQYQNVPTGIIVLDSTLNEHEIATFIAKIRTFEGEFDLPHCVIVSLTHSKQHEEFLLHAGSDYTLESTIRRISFRDFIEKRLVEVKNPQFIATMKQKTSDEILREQYEEEMENKPLSFTADEVKSPHYSEQSAVSNVKSKKEKFDIKLSMLPTDISEESEEQEVTNIELDPREEVKESDTFYANYNKVVPLPSINPAKPKEALDLTQEMVTYETEEEKPNQ